MLSDEELRKLHVSLRDLTLTLTPDTDITYHHMFDARSQSALITLVHVLVF